MQVKNSIKKVGAVVGSALMVGMTMGSAASLADFPQPFVDGDGAVQSQIVVGSQGKVADVVGAINVGASLGQAAVQTTEEETPGVATSDVDGVEEEVALRGTLAGQTLTNLQYSELMFDTVENDDGNDRTVRERVYLNQDTPVASSVTNSTNVVTEIEAGALEYSASYGLGGFAANDTLYVLGEEYEVTNVANDEVHLGSKMETTGLELGESYEHGPYTVEVIDKDSSGDGAIYVEVRRDGEVLTAAGLETGDSLDVDDGDFEVRADEVFFGSQRDYIDVTSVYTDTVVEDGEPSPFDEDWEAGITASNGEVTELTLTNLVALEHDHDDEAENTEEAITAGESFAGPSDYFHLYDLGLTDHDTEDLSFADESSVTFTDANNLEHTLDLTEWANADDAVSSGSGSDTGNGDGAIIQGSNGDTGVFAVSDPNADGANVPVSYEWDDSDLVLTYQGVDVTVASGDLSGGTNADDFGFDILLEQDDNGDVYVDNSETTLNTLYEGELTYDSGTDTATFNEAEETATGNNFVEVTWTGPDGEIDTVSYDRDGTGSSAEADLSAEDDPVYTAHGSVVEFADDDAATVAHPNEQVEHQHALGSTDVEQGDGSTYQAVDMDAQGQLPAMAQLDSDVTDSVKSNNHLILVGGPAVNTLVADLVDSEDVDLSDLEGQSSGALLQTVDDAFADGQHALVVAGVGADDTRNAAQYIANYADHESALADADSRLVLAEADYPSEQ